MNYQLRLATPADAPALPGLIERSISALGQGYYSPAQVAAALQGTFGLDTTLIEDGSYFIVAAAGGDIVACGGWSRRRTLFGSDRRIGRDESLLDPRVDAAKIRAFFVDPGHVRRGLGRMILERAEVDAVRAGFTSFELMATLPGVKLYEQCGYVPGEVVQHFLPGGLAISFVPMTKQIARAPGSCP